MSATVTTGNVSWREGDGAATQTLNHSILVPYAKMNQRTLRLAFDCLLERKDHAWFGWRKHDANGYPAEPR